MTRVRISDDALALACGADAVAAAFAAAGCTVERVSSWGMHWLEPLVEIDGQGFGPANADDVAAILAGTSAKAIGPIAEHPFIARQQRLTFARAGKTRPLSLEDYAATGGWAALTRARAMAPAAVVAEVTRSGLRGRGGAGFPAGIKWETVRKASGNRKYVVCNADEGDSGTFADRMLMEGDPFQLIEGMAIAAHAVGAGQGYIYVRSEYPHAIAKLNAAIALAEPQIAPFRIEVRVGAGAYVCGEETSLLNSIEGKRGEVRAKPPLPALEGLFGCPTVVNNVLTLAAIPHILSEGGASLYDSIGINRSKGTMPIQLAGNINHGGLFETAFGITLNALIHDIGGGTASGRLVKAVQVGGPLGAYIHPSQFDLPFDYEAYAGANALIGHGGVVVFDDTADMGALARFAFQFCAAESCGKCTPCRIGSTRGVELIDRIRTGGQTPDAVETLPQMHNARKAPRSRDEDRQLLEDLCETMQYGSLCALGGFTPYPVRSALKHWPEDFAMGYERQADFGTPAVQSDQAVTLRIDGCEVTVPAGTSVMRAAVECGGAIPSLCATDNVKAFGSCRMCLVEIKGRRGTPASCTTPVEPGMVVQTQTPLLQKLRKGVMELYISDHPLDCLTCSANNDCELQDTAAEVGLRDVRYGYAGENHLGIEADTSNPYFDFDPSKCIACSRCVRACDEVQGTLALTMDGRGFASKISAGQAGDDFLSSECVSCGACVQACPTATLQEKAIKEIGKPERAVITTCAYCGVGCTFRAEMRGEQLVRMVPWKDGKANRGHSCVKGRFAWGYANHQDRITQPMIRESIEEPWRVVSWDEAFAHTAARLNAIKSEYGARALGGITSSRCTNEETFLVQKLVRAGFGSNNVDTCARVCHSPTGYGLKTTFGTSAGTQDFDSVMDSDVILVIGANPTDAHPVFASRMKRRLRQGAKLIVIDPRRIDLVRSPHIQAAHHLPLQPGTNVAVLTAMAHVIVTEGLADEVFIRERCDWDEYQDWARFVSDEKHSPEVLEAVTRVPAAELRAAARLYATGGNGAIYYGLGVTEHSQGSSTVMAIANLAMATGNIGRRGVGVNPLRGQNNVQGACDMGSFPHELSGYRHISDTATRGLFEQDWGVTLDAEPGLRIPNMLDAALDGSFRAIYIQGEDILQSDPNTHHVAAGLKSMELVIVHDLFLNETANYAHVFLPGSTFLEKNGTFTNAERRIQLVRKVMEPANGLEDWQVTQELARAMGLDWNYQHPSDIMDEIARLTPAFAGVSFDRLDREGSLQWPVNDKSPGGSPIMHVDGFVRGKGKFVVTDYVPTDERTGPRFPLLLTTGRILSQYNVGAQTRRTANTVWHDEDLLEIHPTDAENRGIKTGDWVRLASRTGETTLRAEVTERVAPGVVYTTFHHPATQANVVTTEFSDWATNCPEYKVTAVQVTPSNGPTEWQESYASWSEKSRRIAAEPAE